MQNAKKLWYQNLYLKMIQEQNLFILTVAKLGYITELYLPLYSRNYPPLLYRIVVLEISKKFLEIHQWQNSFSTDL